MTTKKSLKDLNLLDRFLFAEAMEEPVIVQYMLEIILGKEITLKYPPQTEREKRTSPLKRFVKLDVWAWDREDVLYDAEVQKEDTKNFPKRSRLYQALIDAKLLKPGETDFNKMNTVFIIMIMPFDLFGEGLYQYTFEMRCKEREGIALGDKAVRIFLNTHGTNDGEVDPELIELLHYMENTTEEVSSRCKSEKIKEMQRRIEEIKSSEEVGVRYMQAWEEKALERQKGREEGKKEGELAGKLETVLEFCRELGVSKEDTIIKIREKCNLSEEDARKYVEERWE